MASYNIQDQLKPISPLAPASCSELNMKTSDVLKTDREISIETRDSVRSLKLLLETMPIQELLLQLREASRGQTHDCHKKE